MQPYHLGELGHEPGLADPGAAADLRQTGAARRGGPPQVLKLAELWQPANEPSCSQPGAGGVGLETRPTCAGRVSVGHQPLECLPRRRIRDNSKLTLQDRSAMVVSADGTGTVAQIGLQQHQGAIPGLL